MSSSTNPMVRWAKPLRRDFLSRVKPVAQRARLLMAVDPSFEDELKALGLFPAIQEVLGIDPKTSYDIRLQHELHRDKLRHAAKGFPTKGGGSAAPLKSIRRRLKQDFAALADDIRVLRVLDPNIDREIARMGLTPLLQHVKT